MHNYKLLLLAINLMGIVVGIGFMIFGGLFVRILYGESYSAAIPALMILIWSTSFSMIGTARTIWIVAEKKNKFAKYYVIIGAIVNTILNAIVIPFWGITGASITTLISQIVVAIIAPYFFKETRSFCNLYWNSFKLIPELKDVAINQIKKIRKNG